MFLISCFPAIQKQDLLEALYENRNVYARYPVSNSCNYYP